MHFKTAILHMHERVSELAEAASHLDNQNLADILKSGAAKLMQASEHADVEAADKLRAPEPPTPLFPAT